MVTGGSGFIGSHIVDKLLEKNHDVVVLDVREPHRKDVQFINVDITSFNNGLVDAMKNVDYIYHLAAATNVDHVYKDPVQSTKQGATATVNILEAARQQNVKRVIFASTTWVYNKSFDESVNENTCLYPSNPSHLYISTKISSELFCRSYNLLYNLPYTILRYGIPYGSRARKGTVIPIFINKALAGEPITITGDGSQYRQFLYVEDLAEGNVAALNEIAKNKIYNLDGSRAISVKEIAETIKHIHNDVKIEYKPARPGDFKGKSVSSEKARRELRWEPKVEFEEGMMEYIAWFKENFSESPVD